MNWDSILTTCEIVQSAHVSEGQSVRSKHSSHLETPANIRGDNFIRELQPMNRDLGCRGKCRPIKDDIEVTSFVHMRCQCLADGISEISSMSMVDH